MEKANEAPWRLFMGLLRKKHLIWQHFGLLNVPYAQDLSLQDLLEQLTIHVAPKHAFCVHASLLTLPEGSLADSSPDVVSLGNLGIR